MKKLYKIRLTIAAIIFILAVLGLLGIFYPVKVLDIQLAPLLQRVFIDFSIMAAVLLASIIILSFIFGRLYCSVICPFGILQEFFGLIKNLFRKKLKIGKSVTGSDFRSTNYPLKYFVAAIVFGILTGGSAIALRYIEPYTIFGSAITISLLGIVAVLIVLAIVLFKNRFFCTNICPVGTLLGLLSKLSVNKIYINKNDCVSCGMCQRDCPSECIDLKNGTVDNEVCIKCFKCLESCHKGAIQYGIESKNEKKFSLKRRQLIVASAALALFGAMVKTGLVIKDKIVEKFKDIILPPGAVSEERIANKCYNCNLCVENCPNNIIVKADKNFPTVHIDYSKGFCKYDCAKCGEICPTGAIKRLKVEDKQKIRIGMAMISEDKCSDCGLCIQACPTHAIMKLDGKPPILNAAKCIGCGACQNVCQFGAVEVFPIREQKTIS